MRPDPQAVLSCFSLLYRAAYRGNGSGFRGLIWVQTFPIGLQMDAS